MINRFITKVSNFRKFIGGIKITPSNKNVELGDKAVPFYYNVSNQLLTNWSFEKTQTEKETYNFKVIIQVIWLM